MTGKYKSDNSDLFSVDRTDDISIMRFRNDFLFQTSDLHKMDSLLNRLYSVSDDDSVNAVIIMGSSEKTGIDEYLSFYREVSHSNIGLTAIERMYNTIDQLIMAIMDCRKPVIHGDCGNIISLFLNISLACDHRIIADNTLFLNPYVDIGAIPIGGGASFLVEILGPSKAYEFLLSDRNIEAKEALDLGIVDRVVPHSDLEEAVFAVAQWFAMKPSRTVRGIKKIINHTRKGLRETLEIENQELFKIINSSDFWKQLSMEPDSNNI